MVVAYVLVKANTGEADRLLDDISHVEGVIDAHVVAGDVDLFAKIEVDAPTDVKRIVADELQGIDGVEDTETYISMN